LDAGLTLILMARESELVRGTALSLRVAQANKAHRVCDYFSVMSYPGAVERCRDALQWFADASDSVVNIAGPRGIGVTRHGRKGGKVLEGVFQHPGYAAMLENCPPSATAFVTTRTTP
jgi:hypothetical protein